MKEQFLRNEMLWGTEAQERLAAAHVIVFGLGGVGGSAAEGLARAGVGKLLLIDNDCFDESNLNRQLFATSQNIGCRKTDEAKKRVISVNHDVVCYTEDIFLNKENIPILIKKYKPDYIADAIDNISAKVSLAFNGEKMGIPVISSMGTGNKLDPMAFECTDIFKTSVCPLAKVMRKLLKDEGVKKLKVVYSKEQPKVKEKTVSSVSFVPSVAGMIIAGEIIKDLCGIN